MQKVVVGQAVKKQDSGEPVVGDIPKEQQNYSVESFPAHIG
jgi:hypothetical protein